MFTADILKILLCVVSLNSAANSSSRNSSTHLEDLIETPEFLKKANDLQRKEYIELEGNPNLVISMKNAALDSWAKKCGEPVLSLYNQYKLDKERVSLEEDARMAEIVKNLSPAAQEADKSVREIMANSSQTKKQMDSNVEKKLNQLPKRVYYELTFSTQ